MISLSLPAVAQGGGFVIIGGGGSATTGFKDDGKCIVSNKDVADWVADTGVFSALNKSYDDALSAWNNISPTKFHHKGGAAGIYWQGQGKVALQSSKDHLFSLARRYISRLKKACDVCYLAKDWATILQFATAINPAQAVSQNPTIRLYKGVQTGVGASAKVTYSIDQSKAAIAIKDLTIGQVRTLDERGVEIGTSTGAARSPTATHAAQFYLTLAGLSINPGGSQFDANQCRTNMGLAGSDPSKYTEAKSTEACTEQTVDQALYYWANNVYSRLIASKSTAPKESLKSKLKQGSYAACPSNVFGNNLWTLGRF